MQKGEWIKTPTDKLDNLIVLCEPDPNHADIYLDALHVAELP